MIASIGSLGRGLDGLSRWSQAIVLPAGSPSTRPEPVLGQPTCQWGPQVVLKVYTPMLIEDNTFLLQQDALSHPIVPRPGADATGRVDHSMPGDVVGAVGKCIAHPPCSDLLVRPPVPTPGRGGHTAERPAGHD